MSNSVEMRAKVTVESIEGIPDLKIIKPKDNHSFSKFGVLRGLHTQPEMGKLVSVVSGEIFDVAVDVRKGSPTFGKWRGVILNDSNKHAFWIPPGFLHGFQCLSKEGAHVTYKCTAVYDPKTEYGINPFDKDINVEWPLKDGLIVSDRDSKHSNLKEIAK